MTIPAPMRGAHNHLIDIRGIHVGHHQMIGDGWLSGTTVILPPQGTVASADVRGGGPGTRETDCLAPTTMVSSVDAVCISGGSAYGLDTAGGVVRWLASRNRGLKIGPEAHHVVPIVQQQSFSISAQVAISKINQPQTLVGKRRIVLR